jgi:lipoprotein NlpD
VERGETLWRISRRYETTVDKIMAANGIKDVTSVRAGTRLKIPGEAPAPVMVATSEEPAEKTFTAPRSITTRVDAKARTTAAYKLRWPVDGTITSRFGTREGRAHDGIDIGAPKGTDVRAAAAGEVVFSARHGGYGNLVVVRHADGLVTVYAHHSVNLVRKGQSVSPGQIIAKVGDSGRASGPHLHFEVRQGVEPQNPLRFLPP